MKPDIDLKRNESGKYDLIIGDEKYDDLTLDEAIRVLAESGN